MSMSAEQERAAFEAWAASIGLCVTGKYAETIDVLCAESAFKAGYQAALQSQDREDAERMEWLETTAHCADWVEHEPTKRVIRATDGAEFEGETWREAIDHARRIEGEW